MVTTLGWNSYHDGIFTTARRVQESVLSYVARMQAHNIIRKPTHRRNKDQRMVKESKEEVEFMHKVRKYLY